MPTHEHVWRISENDPRGYVDVVITSVCDCGAVKTEWTGADGAKNTVIWEPKEEKQ